MQLKMQMLSHHTKYKLYFILLLLVIPMALSQAPGSQIFIGEADGIEIKFPEIPILEQHSKYNFHYHLFNKSNGVPILNTSTECHFHLYNETGSHIYIENNVRNATEDIFDWYVNINGSNFSTPGDYQVLFQCNSSDGFGGFIAQMIEVTEDGDTGDTLDSSSGIAITIFILSCALGLFALGLFKKEFARNVFLHLVLKRSCWVLGIYLMMLNSAMMATIADAGNLNLTSELFRYMWLFGTAGWLLIGFTAIKTVIDLLKMWKIKQNDERMGQDGKY